MGCSALMVLLAAAGREVIVRRKTVRVRTDRLGYFCKTIYGAVYK